MGDVTAARARSSPRRWWLFGAAALITLALFVAAILTTGLVGCGISGCAGGGFGPTYAPARAQVGLLVAGLILLPMTLGVLRGRKPVLRTLAAVTAVVLGTTLAMVVLGLGPNGCPRGQARAISGPESFDPGSSTCSAYPAAVPQR